MDSKVEAWMARHGLEYGAGNVVLDQRGRVVSRQYLQPEIDLDAEVRDSYWRGWDDGFQAGKIFVVTGE